MPKILQDPKNTILNAARKELSEEGVKGFNIRPVAKEAGVATGTIYNYYQSKTGLIAGVIIDNWTKEEAKLFEVGSISKEEAVERVYGAISSFHNANFEHVHALKELAPDCFKKTGSPKSVVKKGTKAFLAAKLGVDKGAASLAAEIIFLAIHDEDVDTEKAKRLALTALE